MCPHHPPVYMCVSQVPHFTNCSQDGTVKVGILLILGGTGQAFSLDFNLRSHMKTHTGDYNECPYAGCEKRYCQEYKLRAHITKEHSKPARGMRKLATTGTDTGQ